jgi:DNA invertase Pin-like site-specific DNA recombinase
MLDRPARPPRPARDAHLARRRGRADLPRQGPRRHHPRPAPALDQALAAVRVGHTLVVPKLDRLARSVPNARDIGDTLVARGVRLSLGGSIYDLADPMSKVFFNMLAVFAEFEADLLKMRTREGMAIARSHGELKGRQPKLSPRQQAELVRIHASGDYTFADLMEVFSVGRATVYRVLGRAVATSNPADTPGKPH